MVPHRPFPGLGSQRSGNSKHTLPQHIRRGATFRALRKSGEPFLAAARVLPHMVDHGVYVAECDGTEAGVVFLAVPEAVELTMPVLDLGE